MRELLVQWTRGASVLRTYEKLITVPSLQGTHP